MIKEAHKGRALSGICHVLCPCRPRFRYRANVPQVPFNHSAALLGCKFEHLATPFPGLSARFAYDSDANCNPGKNAENALTFAVHNIFLTKNGNCDIKLRIVLANR